MLATGATRRPCPTGPQTHFSQLRLSLGCPDLFALETCAGPIPGDVAAWCGADAHDRRVDGDWHVLPLLLHGLQLDGQPDRQRKVGSSSKQSQQGRSVEREVRSQPRYKIAPSHDGVGFADHPSEPMARAQVRSMTTLVMYWPTLGSLLRWPRCPRTAGVLYARCAQPALSAARSVSRLLSAQLSSTRPASDRVR